MKKLIPALCMLLVAACLMGTSTYAWFAANESVTASGMAIQAAADGGLGIASYTIGTANAPVFPATTDFAASNKAVWNNQLKANGSANTAATVTPVSTMNGTWFTGNSDNANTAAVGTKGYKPVTNTPAGLAGYTLMTSWVVKSLDQSGKTYGLKVSSIALDTDTTDTTADKTQSDGSKNLNKSLRVAIAVTDITDATGKLGTTTTWYYFAPFQTGAATAFNYVAADTTDPTKGVQTAYKTTDKMTVGTISADGVYILDKGLDTLGVKVDVYVYYEGEDENCKTANIALDVDKLALKISYASAAEITGS